MTEDQAKWNVAWQEGVEGLDEPLSGKANGETGFYKTDIDGVEELAARHVDWLWSIITPIVKLMAKTEFIHGYKHGYDQSKITKK